jgi:hypothetical protein
MTKIMDRKRVSLSFINYSKMILKMA